MDRALLRKFATGKISAVQFNLSPERGFEPRWRPRINGKGVRNADDPDEGFMTRNEAKSAAARFKEHCRIYLHNLELSD